VSRPRHLASVALALVALALLTACDGGEDEQATTSPASGEAPEGRPTPRSSPAQLPPEFVKCMADQGFKVTSPDDIHSAPPGVLQACFGALHSGEGP
jgi:hypothetical protein